MLRRPTPGSVHALAIAATVAASLIALAAQNGAYDVVPRQAAALLAWFGCGVIAVASTNAPQRPNWAGVATTLAAAAIAFWISAQLGSTLSRERTAIELARATAHVAPLILIGWLTPRDRWGAIIVGAAAAGVVIVATGFAERLFPGLIEAQRTIVFENTSDRLATPLGYWNALGSWSLITLLLLLSMASHAPRAAVRAAALAFAPLAVAVAYLTYSRSAIGAGILAAGVLLVLAHHRWTLAVHAAGIAAASAAVIATIRANPEIAGATGNAGWSTVLIATLAAGALMAALAAGTAWLGVDERRLPTRIGRPAAVIVSIAIVLTGLATAVSQGPGAWDTFSTGNPQETGASRLTDIGNGPRVDQWRTTLDAWRTERATGHGAGTFELLWNRSPHADGGFVRDAHSALLETLAEQGTVGALLLLSFLLATAGAVVSARRRARGAVELGLVAGAGAGISAFLIGSMFDWFWEVTALAALMLTLLGAMIAASRPNEANAPSIGSGRALRVGIVAISLLAALIQLPGLVGTSDLRRSQQAAERREFAEARALANRAIDTMPWASSPFLQRALIDEQAGAFTPAITGLKLAMRRDPHDWRLPLVLARVEAKAGHPRAALTAYRAARRLRPTGQFFAVPVSPPPARTYPTP